tara:strand:- start:294 stop:464 length:171 start_codon:yes stop_codon:yes gene_type:complete
MGKKLIALKNVRACTALPRNQKKRSEIVEQKCPQKDQQKIGFKIIELFLSDEIGTN